MTDLARAGLPRCRRCGASPQIHIDNEIVPGTISHAISCSNSECYNDTHWQMSAAKAEEIWINNPVPVGVKGGQGCPSDDVAETIN